MAAPITLTKPQFLATASGQKPGSNYQGYLSFIAKARAAKLGAAPADPYSSIIGALPKPQTSQQIQQQAASEISPLVAAATKQITNQVNAQTGAISGFSNDAAAKLAALDYTAPYTTGEQSQAAVDDALRQQLAGAGSSDSASLASRLAALGSNDPTVAAAASNVASNGAAAGTTELAHGSAALGNLIANAASAGSYGQKLPGIERLAGLQEIGAAQQAGQNNIATQTQALESQLPSIVQSLTGENDSRASAISSAQQNQLARNDAINATAAKNSTAVSVATIKARTAANEAEIKQGQSDRSYRLQFAKTFGVDPVTGKTIPGFTTNQAGQVVKVGTTKTGAAAGAKPPTANEINTWVSAFKNGKPVTTSVLAPKPDANGNPVYRSVRQSTGQLNYLQAYKRLTALHVPDPEARQALDTVYKRGEQGRSWLSNEEQATLSQAKLAPQAHRYKGVAYLDRTQAEALTASNKMPPGHWIQGSTKTQDLGPVYVIDETY